MAHFIRQIFVFQRQKRGQHRRQRRPQFVTEHREEAVFREIGPLGFGAGFLRRLVKAALSSASAARCASSSASDNSFGPARALRDRR